MGNRPVSERLDEDEVVAVIRDARERRTGAIRALMEHFGLPEANATYQYMKCIKKGRIRERRNEHLPAQAIMFAKTRREVRLTMCQVCKVMWPCQHEVLRLQTVADPEHPL